MTLRNTLSLCASLWRRPVARLLTSLCILGILVGSMPIPDLWITVKQVSPSLWGFVVLAFILGHCVGVVKWRLFINMGQSKLPFRATFQCYFAGLFANLFLPSIAGGDVVRAGLAVRFKGDKQAVIFGTILDRFLDASSLGIIILVGALYSPSSLAAEGRAVLLGLLLSVIIFVLGVFMFLMIPIPSRVPRKLREWIEGTRNIIRELLKRPQRAFAGLFLALFIQSAFVLLNAVLGAACRIELPLYVWFLVWPLAKLTAMLPISLGGLGVREMALAVFLGQFGVPISSSVGLGLLWETVIATGGGLGGIFYFLAKKSGSRSASIVAETLPAARKAVS